MADGYWFAPETEENSMLGNLRINTPITVEVRIVHSIYQNMETGFAVYSVEDSLHRWFRINGYFPTPVKLDAFYTVDGVVKDSKYGRVLQVLDYRSAFPKDTDGIITVLRTLPGLDTRAPMVYEMLGENALNLILEDPDSVAIRLKGLGIKQIQKWQKSLQGMKESDVILQTLQNYKVPANAAAALLEKYPDIIDRLHRSPYFLAEEIRGFGFLKCDRIALDNGYPVGGQERLEQAMLYVLSQAAQGRGDCYMLYPDFVKQVRSVLEIRIDFRTARALLAQKGAIQYRMGKRIIAVNRDDLSDELSRFREHPKRQDTFAYCCEAPSDEEYRLAFRSLRNSNRIVLEDDRVYAGYVYTAEEAVASCLKALVDTEYEPFKGVETTLNKVCKEIGATLEEKQRDAVLRFCAAKGGVFVLNGRAGCGKTFTLDIIIKVLQELYRMQGLMFTAEVMAPTGKAAQVVQKATNLTAQTVHKALHIVADGDNEANTIISCDCVVIDEFSMMGVSLAASLFKAVYSGTKVIIMGDYEQLPSIEPGFVLKDIIEAGIVPVITLDVVKRQTEGSGVLYNANEILEGHMIRSRILNKGKIRNNAYIFRTDTNEECRNSIVDMVKKVRGWGYSIDDIQVICPQKKTDVGIYSLNYFIQEALNPSHGGKEVLSSVIQVRDKDGKIRDVKLMLREGDKVINTSNNYSMKFFNFRKGEGFIEDYTRVGIVNGETGRIAKIVDVKANGKPHQRIYVRYGENQYAMYEDTWDELTLAYAMTIHRAQGSQWPVIIAPVMLCNRIMLSRKLFYTLYTRAQESCIIFGTPEAVQYAINNNTSAKRNTWLKQRLSKK